eukprot:scaffold17787_cov56-Phaeocystis_antarctica.AAC.6
MRSPAVRSEVCEQGGGRCTASGGSRDLLDVVRPAEGVLESLLVPLAHDLVARVAESGAELAAAVEKVGHRDGGHGRDRPRLRRTASARARARPTGRVTRSRAVAIGQGSPRARDLRRERAQVGSTAVAPAGE